MKSLFLLKVLVFLGQLLLPITLKRMGIKNRGTRFLLRASIIAILDSMIGKKDLRTYPARPQENLLESFRVNQNAAPQVPSGRSLLMSAVLAYWLERNVKLAQTQNNWMWMRTIRSPFILKLIVPLAANLIQNTKQ